MKMTRAGAREEMKVMRVGAREEDLWESFLTDT